MVQTFIAYLSVELVEALHGRAPSLYGQRKVLSELGTCMVEI